MQVIGPIVDALRPLQIRGINRTIGKLFPWSGEREIRINGGLSMRIDMANGQQRMMFFGCFDREIEMWLRRVLRPGDAFLDIGANVGYLSLLASQLVGSSGKVCSVEPCPPTFERLKNHVELNELQNVDIHQLAISDQKGTLRLFVPPTVEHRDFNVSCVRNNDYQEIVVPAETLDACIDQWAMNSIRLMKVDVEGAEPLVFAGGPSRLSKGTVQFLICEHNGPYLLQVGSSVAALYEQITQLGFKVARLTRDGHVVSAKTPDLSPTAVFDAFFAHESAPTQI